MAETYRKDNDPNWSDNPTAHDDVQHGIDDNPTGDAEKGAALGGIGGAVTGAIAGSMAGPGGTILGAVIGGVAGAVASGAAVGAVDRIDNDNTVSGLGDGVTSERDATVNTGYNTTDTYRAPDAYASTNDTISNAGGTYAPTAQPDLHKSWNRDATDIDVDANKDSMPGNGVPGIQTGGHTVDGTPDTRGIWEKAEDTVTGDKWDDKTGKRVA